VSVVVPFACGTADASRLAEVIKRVGRVETK